MRIYIYISICLFYEIDLAILTKKATPIHLLYKTLLICLTFTIQGLCWYDDEELWSYVFNAMLTGTLHAWYWPKHIKDYQICWHQQCHIDFAILFLYIPCALTGFLHCRFERRDLPHAFPWKLLVCAGICTWVQDLVEPLRYALTLSLCNFLGGSCEHRFKQHMNEYNV